MNAITLRILLALALSATPVILAQDTGGKTMPDPELAALRQQNEMLEKKVKLLTEQQHREKSDDLDPVAKQTELIEQRLKLLVQQQSFLSQQPITQNKIADSTRWAGTRDGILIENVHKAYTALNDLAPAVAKEFDCAGKNIVLYGPAQSDELLSVKVFNDQLDQLRNRLEQVLTIGAPAAPDKPGADTSVYGVAALSGPVLRSVLDLISFFHSNTAPAYDESIADEKGLVAIMANAATAGGCKVYLPDQFVNNPFNSASQVTAKLQSVADLSDNAGIAGKAPGLQQRIRELRIELKRSDSMSLTLSEKIEDEETMLSDASKRVDFLKGRVDWVSLHIKDGRNAALQTKLNQTFDKSWSDLDAAVKRQLASTLPQTMEDQNKVNESVKRLDLLKTRADWLAQYVKDEKDLALQDKMKHILATSWEDLETAVKALEAAAVSVPKAIEPKRREQQRWDKYSADLKELIATATAASEAYTTFRGALLDGSSGRSPLSRMLRAEALRDLIFDEKFQERPGATVVQLTLQQLAGTSHLEERVEDFSGGVVLSFIQYEPNGKLKKSGVHTVYSGFKSKL
jgi:hypothetical protein